MDRLEPYRIENVRIAEPMAHQERHPLAERSERIFRKLPGNRANARFASIFKSPYLAVRASGRDFDRAVSAWPSIRFQPLKTGFRVPTHTRTASLFSGEQRNTSSWRPLNDGNFSPHPALSQSCRRHGPLRAQGS